LAIGKAFADEGAAVVLADRSAAVAERAVELGQSARTRTEGRIVDVVDYEGMRRLADGVVAEFGRADHIVYAAGMGSGKFGFPFWNLSPSDWPRVLEVNLVGAVNTAHAFAPHLAAARRGTVLMISSVAAQIGSQTDPPYFTHCAAKDFAAYDVRVNAICPGMVQTPLNRGVWQAWHDSQPPESRRSYEDWAGEKVRKIAPLGRWQTPEDIAAMAVFLASPRANNITGQTLNVDGGQVMHC
jgi:NAD(P)-dependent dehydrogenase (short-subunit alcohol dehydrogenase family)